MTRTGKGAAWIAAGAAAAIVSLALLWPGVATFDSWAQYQQAVSGQYDDWHPPVTARVWSLLLAAGLRGTGPMLALQLLLYWVGFGLLAAGLAPRSRRLAAAALALALLPPVAGWMHAVLKDCLLLAALVAATGLIAWHRLRRRRLGPAAALGVALLLAFAVLARANSVFGVAPLALAWAGWLGLRRVWARALLLGAATLAAIGLSGPVNHRLLGAEPSGVERTLPLFDMAGIAHFAGLPTIPHLAPAAWAAAERRGCYQPFYWDPYTDPAKCGWVADAVMGDRDPGEPSIFRDWAGLIARHPLAYAEHRLAHLDATLRVAMPADERIASAPGGSDANPAMIGWPHRAAGYWLAIGASRVARTPLGAPWVWLVGAMSLVWLFAGTPAQPARDLGLALALSALFQTASFAIVSIASDLRYHLWLFAATAIAALLAAACDRVPRHRLRAALALTLAAAAVSVMLRR